MFSADSLHALLCLQAELSACLLMASLLSLLDPPCVSAFVVCSVLFSFRPNMVTNYFRSPFSSYSKYEDKDLLNQQCFIVTILKTESSCQ